jgi:AhpD family alkylhydroperoxidase
MLQRMNYNAVAPAGMKALGAVYGYVRQSELPSRLVDLVFLRVSQINGCAYCIDMHSHELLKAGLPIEHLVLVAVWPEAGSIFDKQEREALAWAENVTRLGDRGVPDSAGGRGVWRKAARRPDDRGRRDERLQPNSNQLPSDARGARRLTTSAGMLINQFPI